MRDYEKDVPKVFGWPLQIIDNDELYEEIIGKPTKYINWLIWILKTAPTPETKEDEMCKEWIKNFLCEILSVNRKFDYIDNL